MIAGTLELQMFANMARLANDMATAKNTVGNAVREIEHLLGAIGVGFSASVLLEKINSVVDGMDKLKESSEKTGASVENLSKLQFFAGVSGSSIDGVTQALVKLSKAEASAGNDTAPATQALKFLGRHGRRPKRINYDLKPISLTCCHKIASMMIVFLRNIVSNPRHLGG